MPFTIGEEAINRAGQFGGVAGIIRFLINLGNPSPQDGCIAEVAVYITQTVEEQKCYLIIFKEEAVGFFSSRSYVEVDFPLSVGYHKLDGFFLEAKSGDFIGIGMPPIGNTDVGIDCDGAGGSGVRHNQAGLTLPIVNEAFDIYPTSIMSEKGYSGIPSPEEAMGKVRGFDFRGGGFRP